MGGLRSALCEGREADAIGDEFDADRLKGAMDIHNSPALAIVPAFEAG
jgi:hypothetical protein